MIVNARVDNGSLSIELPSPESKTLRQAVKEHVLKVYEQCGHDKKLTAKMLDVSVKTVYNHLKRYRKENLHGIGV